MLKSGTLARLRQNLSASVQTTETIKIQLNMLISFDNPHEKHIEYLFKTKVDPESMR